MAEPTRDFTQDKETTPPANNSRRGTSARGFASMDPEKQREIARKGGRAAHLKGTAHEFTPEEARVAGRKGGEAVSRDRAHMAQIGREGGQARGARARAAAQGQGGMGSVHPINRNQNHAEKHTGEPGGLGPNVGGTDKDYKQSGGGAM